LRPSCPGPDEIHPGQPGPPLKRKSTQKKEDTKQLAFGDRKENVKNNRELLTLSAGGGRFLKRPTSWRNRNAKSRIRGKAREKGYLEKKKSRQDLLTKGSSPGLQRGSGICKG